MKPAAGVLLTLALLVAVAVPPAAGQAGGQSQAVVALHIAPSADFSNRCTWWYPDQPCGDFTTSWPLGAGAMVYMIVARADSALGVSGLSCGVRYQSPGTVTDGVGVDVFGYTFCSDFQFPQSADGNPNHLFPYSGGGNRFIWDSTANCRRHVVAPYGVETIACAFYVYAYSPDEFRVTPNETGAGPPEFQVLDCDGAMASELAFPGSAGMIGFDRAGFNPCTDALGSLPPPVLLNASGAPGHDEVSVLFSEEVFDGAAVSANYEVHPTAYPASPLEVNAVSVLGPTVTLTLASNLDGVTQYSVDVSNVGGWGGSPIAPNSTVTFTTAVLDSVPPNLTGASGSAGKAQVLVDFSEAVGGGGATASNFSVYPVADPAGGIAVCSAAASGARVTLTLASSLAWGTQYEVRVSNVQDKAGNVIAPNSTATFTTQPGDTTPPTLVAVTGAASSDGVLVDFSETVAAGTVIPANFAVYPALDPASPLEVIETSASGSRARLTLASKLAGFTQYAVSVSNVTDTWGNVIAPNATATFTTGAPDLTPPTLTLASGSAGDNRITVFFSEAVGANAAVATNYAVHPSDEPSAPLAVLAAVIPPGSSSSEVILTLDGALDYRTYTVVVSGVRDVAGNPIAPDSPINFTATSLHGLPGGQSQSVVTLHVQTHVAKQIICDGLSSTLSCNEFVQTWPVHKGADVYLVVAWARADLGISGVSCGIRYDPAPGAGCDVLGYSSCADLEYTNAGANGEWPASGGGNRLIWLRTTNCQRTERPACAVHAVAAGFYVYAYGPDQFAVIQNENLETGPEFQVVDCDGPVSSSMEFPTHAGKVGFGMAGYNPCTALDVPTVHTTWGRLKNQYH